MPATSRACASSRRSRSRPVIASCSATPAVSARSPAPRCSTSNRAGAARDARVAPPVAARGAAARPHGAGARRRHPATHRSVRAGGRRARRLDGRVGCRGARRRVTRRPVVAARPPRTSSRGGAGDVRRRSRHVGEHAGDGGGRRQGDGGGRRATRRGARDRARGHAVADRRVTRSRRARSPPSTRRRSRHPTRPPSEPTPRSSVRSSATAFSSTSAVSSSPGRPSTARASWCANTWRRTTR